MSDHSESSNPPAKTTTTTTPTTPTAVNTDTEGTTSKSKMPSIFSAVWQPHKKQAQEKAKNIVRTISYRDPDTADSKNANGQSILDRSPSLNPNLNIIIIGTGGHPTSPTSPNGVHPGPQLNRAEQKALKREQKAKYSQGVTSPISTGGNSTPLVSNANAAGGATSRPMSPTHAAVAAALGDGSYSHQGTPVVSRNDRYGYLEHSGRGLHLGMYSASITVPTVAAFVRADVERRSMTHCDRDQPTNNRLFF